METSKKIALCTILLYTIFSTEVIVLSIFQIDTSPFATQLICTTGGICATALVAYFVKSNRENIIREKKELIKWEYEFRKTHSIPFNDDSEEILTKDINDIKEALEDKLDQEVTSSIQQDIEIKSL